MYRRQGHGAIVCRYLPFHDPRLNETFRLPMVHIRLKQGTNSVRTDALLDSGATATFIPIDFMNMIGFNLKTQEEKQAEAQLKEGEPIKQPSPQEQEEKYKSQDSIGAGGTFKTYRVELESLQVLKGGRVFCNFEPISVLVPSKADALPHAILGRDSIFRRFDITYREHQEHVVLRRYKR